MFVVKLFLKLTNPILVTIFEISLTIKESMSQKNGKENKHLFFSVISIAEIKQKLLDNDYKVITTLRSKKEQTLEY